MMKKENLETVNALQFGDILLLRGNSALSKANLSAQFIKSSQSASFTHVAIAYSPLSIIDANPRVGVKIHPWSLVKSNYDLDKSKLARNLSFAGDEELCTLLLRNLNYYYSQPYKLFSLFSLNSQFIDGKGIICSQFVAAAFNNCGIIVSNKRAKRSIPEDIAQFLYNDDGWDIFSIPNSFKYFSSFPDALDMKNQMETMDQFVGSFIEKQIALSKTFNQIEKYFDNLLALTERDDIDNDMLSGLKDVLKNYAEQNDEFPLDFWCDVFLVQEETSASFLHEERYLRVSDKDRIVKLSEKRKEFAQIIYPEIYEGISEVMKQLGDIKKSLLEKKYKAQDVCKIVSHLEKVLQVITNCIKENDSLLIRPIKLANILYCEHGKNRY